MTSAINKNGWVETTVGQLVDQEILFPPVDGNHGEIHPKSEDFVSHGIPFVMATDLKNGKVDLVNCKFISKPHAETLRKGFAKNGDVLLSHKATIGRVALLKTHLEYILLTPQVTFYRVRDESKLSNEFLKFYFESPGFQKTLLNYAGGGSTRDYIGITKQLDLPVFFPPLPEQRAIATVLSSLDDKIELLREQNKTLEAMAQELFREWFTEFNFPDANGKPYKKNGGKMIDSELGEIPEGWRVGSLTDIATFLNGLAAQKFPPEGLNEYLSVIKIKEMSSGITSQTGRMSQHIPEKYIVRNGDVLFSWSGSLDVKIWEFGIGGLNQHLFKVTSERYPKWFYFYWIKKHLPDFKQTATAKAVTMGHIQRHHLDDAKVVIPTDQDLKILDKLMTPIFSKTIFNSRQIQVFSTLRDELLPKLMTGNLKVPTNC